MSLDFYICLMPWVAILPLGVGYTIGQWRRERGVPGNAKRTLRWVIIGVLVWLGAAWGARWYGETDLWGWQVAEAFAHRWKWFIFCFAALFGLAMAAPSKGAPGSNRRAAFVLPAIALVVFVTVWRTIPIYIYLPKIPLRDKQGCTLQSIEATCGPVSLANLHDYYQINWWANVRRLAEECGTSYEGTTRWGLVRTARKSGLRVLACRKMTLEELEEIDAPAIVSISTLPSVRHATLFMWTIGNEVHFIDPAYGRRVISRERFLETWYGKTIVLDRR